MNVLHVGWALEKLDSSLVDITSGFACARSKAVSQGLLHLRPYNIDVNGNIDLSQVIYIPDDYVNNVESYYLQTGDILFNNTNSFELVGKSALIKEPIICAFSNHITRLRIVDTSRLDPVWLLIYLRKLFADGYFSANSNRWIGQVGFAASKLSQLDIPLPPLETQQRTVLRLETLLGEVKSARELQVKIEEDTEQLLDAFFAETFSDANGWENHPISKFADVKGGKRLPKGEKFAEGQTEFPYLRVVDFKDFSIYKESLKYLTPEIQQRIRRYTISKDDIYISIAGTIGLVGTIPPELDGSNLTENAAKIVFRPEYKEKIDPKFIAYYLASPHGKQQIKKYTMAAGQPKLALIRIQTIEVPLPDINIQKNIVNRIDLIRQEIIEMQRAQYENAELLEQTEQSLLAQAFRGEL